MSNLYKGPYKDASYHVSVHLAKRLQRRFFRNQPIIFRFISQSGFREEEFLEINQSETRIAFSGHVC
jgi:hypothetical protein